MSDQPLAIDLFCGLGGWTEGLLEEGWRVVGFDIERHSYDDARYPAQLVLQDVLTIHGSQFASADLIVASPPCQEYSYMAMPWSIAKQKAREYRDGTRDRRQLTALFDACFRIQHEACEAAGRFIPLVVENVRGAQEWVGRARWHFGSFYLWGDVPALMPMTRKHVKVPTMGAGWYPPDHPKPVPGLAFNGHAERALRATKNDGGSWFNIAHNTTSGKGRNPDGRRTDVGNGVRFTSRDCGIEGRKVTGDWFGSYADMKASGTISPGRLHGKGSPKRKAAAAHIAKIPRPLSRWIARAWYPQPALMESQG